MQVRWKTFCTSLRSLRHRTPPSTLPVPLVCVAIVLLMLITPYSFAATWYVDVDSDSGVEDGLSWATAFRTIQPAIDAAADDGGGEVWVAAGRYGEERDALSPEDSQVSGALLVPNDVHLLGGFNGNEVLESERVSQSIIYDSCSSSKFSSWRS